MDEVAGLVDAGFPDAAAKLAEYALELLVGHAFVLGRVCNTRSGVRLPTFPRVGALLRP